MGAGSLWPRAVSGLLVAEEARNSLTGVLGLSAAVSTLAGISEDINKHGNRYVSKAHNV